MPEPGEVIDDAMLCELLRVGDRHDVEHWHHRDALARWGPRVAVLGIDTIPTSSRS